MGVVSNPQAGEQALTQRARTLGLLNQPMLSLGDAAMRDVLSTDAELRRAHRNMSANIAGADQMPATGRQADLTDRALARTSAGGTAGDLARASVRNAEQTKRLRFSEQKFGRLGAAQRNQAGVAVRGQRDAFARQDKKNVKSDAVAGTLGTVTGGILGAAAHQYQQNKLDKILHDAGVANVQAGAQGIGIGTAGADAVNTGTVEDALFKKGLVDQAFAGSPRSLS